MSSSSDGTLRKAMIFPDTETGSPQPFNKSMEVLSDQDNVRHAVSCSASRFKRCCFPREERGPSRIPLAVSSST